MMLKIAAVVDLSPIDVVELYKQKRTLVEVQSRLEEDRNSAWEELEGLLNLLDVITDQLDPLNEWYMDFLDEYGEVDE